MNLPNTVAPSPVCCPECGRSEAVIVVLDLDANPLWYRCIRCGGWDAGVLIQASLFGVEVPA